MRTVAALVLLILILLVFLFRPGTDGPASPPASPAETGTGTEAPCEEAPTATPDADPSPGETADGGGERTGKLRFRILAGDEPGRTPVPGAVLTVFHNEPEGWVEVGRATADADGIAEVGGLDTTWYTHECVVSAEGWSRTWIHSLHPEVDPRTWTVVLPGPSPVEGRVLDALTGWPVPGARVRSRDRGRIRGEDVEIGQGPVMATATTAADGTFRFEEKPALLEVAAPGYATVRRETGEPPVEVRLSPGEEISGRVTDPDGRPVAEVVVCACPRWASTHGLDQPTEWRMRTELGAHEEPRGTGQYFTAGTARTDADGRYRITGLVPREEHWVWGTVEGRPRTGLTPVRTDGEECHLRLLRPASLTLRLSEPDGRGIYVCLEPTGTPGFSASSRAESGSVVLVEGLLPGTYEVDLRPHTHPRQTFRVTLAEGEAASREVDLAANRRRPEEMVEVTGVVVDDLGHPIPDAQVHVDEEDGGWAGVDERGRYAIRVPANREVGLRGGADGHYETTVKPGVTRIVVPRRMMPEFWILAPRGGPDIVSFGWCAGEYSGSGSWEGPRARKVKCDFPGGSVDSVRVVARGYLPVRVPIPPDLEACAELPRVTLSVGASLHLRVTGRNGRGLEAKVRIRQEEGDVLQSATTDAEGRVRVTGLVPGVSAEAGIRADGHLGGEWRGRPGGDEVTIVLDPKARLRGQVRYGDGLPGGAVHVRAQRLDEEGESLGGDPAVDTDNAGHFTLFLAPGRYRLWFQAPTSGERRAPVARTITLHADKQNVHTFEIPRP